jgi:hypothetical protein
MENRSFEAAYLRLRESYNILFSSESGWETEGTSKAAA